MSPDTCDVPGNKVKVNGGYLPPLTICPLTDEPGNPLPLEVPPN